MTLDEQLQRSAQEVQDRFKALEPPHLPTPVTRPRSRVRSGPVVAAAAFLAAVVLGATLWWLGPFAGENPDVAGGAAIDTPTTQSCASAVDPTPATDTPVLAAAVPRPHCGALANVLDAYFGAWTGHDPNAILSFFQPEFAIVVDGPVSGPELGTYGGDEARVLIEGWFTDGLRTERTREGGGTGSFHVESTTYTFGSGEPIHAIDVLEFTADPFASARQEESPLVAHYIFLLGDEPSLTWSTARGHLSDGGTLESLSSLIADGYR